MLRPFAGKANDNMIAPETQIMEKLLMNWLHLQSTQCPNLYSDAFYTPGSLLVPPNLKEDIAKSQKAFISAISPYRISVE